MPKWHENVNYFPIAACHGNLEELFQGLHSTYIRTFTSQAGDFSNKLHMDSEFRVQNNDFEETG